MTLDALLELARSAGEDPLPRVLETVADTIFVAAGFRTVVLNTFRPEWDDYEAIFVVGDQKSRDALFGTTMPHAALQRLLGHADRRLANLSLFLTGGGSVAWAELDDVYTPDLPPSEDPDAWQAEDALLVMLSDTGGAPLGFVSMDEPASGRRPTDTELGLLRMICSYAEHALRTARRAKVADDHKQLLAHLSEASPKLSACGSRAALETLVVDAITRHFGYERVAIYALDGAAMLRLSASSGWAPESRLPPALEWVPIRAQLALAGAEADGWLLDAKVLFGASGGERSRRNGRGPRAWNDHCLVIPWTFDEHLQGLVIVEDPSSRRLPSKEHRRALRLLIEIAASVQASIAQREHLDRLASHDALTGVRNRRGLDQLVAGHGPVALLLCDLDHFKQVNDRYGHDTGDRVLAAFGHVLRQVAREDDVPIRLGGEEFCVVLPNTDEAGALAAAERIRAEAAALLAKFVPGGVTVSIGVALSGAGALDARSLLKVADAGLYRAKQDGRNRTILSV